MPTPVTIPKATIAMEEATVLGWRKQEGDEVERDEILFEMETDKVTVEVPAPAAGVLLRIDVREGIALVEQPIAWIGQPGELLPGPVPAARVQAAPAAPPIPPPAARPAAGGVSASPAARRRARELGIDLSKVRGTGPGGRITQADVERAGEGG